MVYNKIGTRKIYDFSDKYLPCEYINMKDPFISYDDYHEWSVKRRIGSIGLLWNKRSDAWLKVQNFKSDNRNKAIDS